MREIDQARFAAAHRDGAVVIDVREPSEYVAGHVPGARLIPLGQLPAHAADLPGNAPVYLVCATGNRSGAMADVLDATGYHAVNVVGGTAAWLRAGHPIES